MRINAWMGWRPDKPDFRDFKFGAPPRAVLPPIVDLRPGFPAVYDQGELGSCTANAIAGCIEYLQRKQKKAKQFLPSRLFIYYNERAMEGTIDEDAGAEIRDGIKSVNKLGAPPEDLWPYDAKGDLFKTKPSAKAFKEATKYQALEYQRVGNSAMTLRACLAKGLPLVFGFTVYDSIDGDEATKLGIIPIPGEKEGTQGGHAVAGVGYTNDLRKVHSLGAALVLPDWAKTVGFWMIVRNSWAADWGDKGYCYIPFDFITNDDLATDFWTIKLIE